MSLLRRLVSFLRTAWLIVGISLLLGFLLEGLYRAQGGLRSMITAQGPRHPNARESWWSEWEAKEGAVNGPSLYDPYRGWWAAPYASRWVHIDSAGHRLTRPAPERRGGPRILFLGGSVMWGYTTPDSLTIPSMVARQLHDSGFAGAEVVNLAQPSYNLTQGTVSLVLELREGRHFDAVVSLDGNNDALAYFTEGHPGAAFGEKDLARRSAVGWRGFWSNVIGLSRYSSLVARLARLVGPGRDGQHGGAGQLPCDTVASYYANLVAVDETLGQSAGFRPIMFWQPHWATTGKSLTAHEAAIRSPAGFPGLMRSCTAAVESLMTARGDSAFVSLTRLFDGDSSDIFLDEFGHLTPRGNGAIAAESVKRLLPILRGR